MDEPLSRVRRKQQEASGGGYDYGRFDPNSGDAYGAKRSGRNLRSKRYATQHMRRQTFTWLYCLIVAAAIVVLLRIFVVEITPVDGPSMENTFFTGEQILVDRISYHVRKPQRGEIVICRYPDDTNAYVKRIIAIEGETVEIISGAMWVNDALLDESAYWQGKIAQDMPKVLVPDGHIFVVGDNRNRSTDSRYPNVGPIPMERVNGKAMALIWPVSRFHFLQ